MEKLKAKPRSERKTKRPPMTEAQKDKIVEMYNRDFRIADIANQQGISQSTVYRVLRERR